MLLPYFETIKKTFQNKHKYIYLHICEIVHLIWLLSTAIKSPWPQRQYFKCIQLLYVYNLKEIHT